MNNDSFQQLESLFHDLSSLSEPNRDQRLIELAQTNPPLSSKLRSMFDSITHAPDYLDPSTIESQTPIPIQIAVDGSTVLADRYTIIECIGIGGSSTVFRAHATNPNRDVAIKMLRFGLSSNNARDRFDHESKALATLTHPHIAHIYETGIHTLDGVSVPWIAMELIHESCTIMDYVRKNKPDQHQRIRLFTQVCNAIKAAHAAGVLHLDLNASNILIDTHGYPKIIDFGLAGLLHSSRTNNLAAVGTRTSMAPEQTLFGSTPFDQRTDIYALGLLLVELLTGHQLQAFLGQTDQETRQLIAMGKARELLTELDEISDQHRQAADKMLRVDPDDRFATVGNILEQFQHAQPQHKSRYPIALVAFVAFLLVLTAGWLISSRPSSKPSSNTLALSPELAIGITSENPRDTKYSENKDRVIAGIATALESNNQLDSQDAAELHATLAGNHRIAGQYDEAITQYRKTIELLTEPDETSDRNWSLLNLAELQIFTGRISQAQETLLQIDRSTPHDPLFLLDLGIAESQIHIAHDQPEQAMKQIQYTTTFLGSLPPERMQERVERMISLSDLLADINQPKESIQLLHKAKSFIISASPPQIASEAFINVAIANALFDRDDPNTFSDAKANILRAIDIFESTGDEFHTHWASRQLANIYLATGDAQNALELYKQAETHISTILGQDHHETIVCRAYRHIAHIALESNTAHHTDAFNEAIVTLTHLLGGEHPVIHSLNAAEQRIRSKINQQLP